MKPHKRTGRVAREQRQASAKDRNNKPKANMSSGEKIFHKIFGKAEKKAES
jgi:hypothetical protein